MKKFGFLLVVMLIALTMVFPPAVFAKTVTLSLKDRLNASYSDYNPQTREAYPVITWSGDFPTLYGNGDDIVTQLKSIYQELGLDLEIKKMDYFTDQVEPFMSGEMKFLRGTLLMVNLVAQMTEGTGAAPVVFYNKTRSTGGDMAVVRGHVKTLYDVKTIVLQLDGPHIYYAWKLFKTVGIKLSDLNIIWTKDLTDADDTPANVFRARKDVDMALVISPDGNDLIGGGSELSVEGSYKFVSTATSRQVIFDVVAVRYDYYMANKAMIDNIVVAELLSVSALKNLFDNSKNQKEAYNKMLTAASQVFLGTPDLSEIIVDMYKHDSTHQGLAGNIDFLTNPKNLRNFQTVNAEIQQALIDLGYLSKKVELKTAELDWGKIKSQLIQKAKELSITLENVDKVKVPKLNKKAVTKIVTARQAERKVVKGEHTKMEGEIYYFNVPFEAKKKDVTREMLEKAVDLDDLFNTLATHPLGILVVEAHTDPYAYTRYLKKGLKGKALGVVRSAKVLSQQRADNLVALILEIAAERNVEIAPEQLEATGMYFQKPLTGLCGKIPCHPEDKKDWETNYGKNRRAEFRLLNVEPDSGEIDAWID